MFLFNLNVVLTMNVLKMVPIRVRFSPGFPPGAGFHEEEFALACFEHHAGAVKNSAFSTEAALRVRRSRISRRGMLRHTSSATQRGQFYGEETGSMCTVGLVS
jgi:hypothetical protein